MNALVARQVDIAARMGELLATLAPQVVEIHDESGNHIGHEGAKAGGGHYRLLIVSEHFRGQDRLARHRMIYVALGSLMQREIHALVISAYTQEELDAVFPISSAHGKSLV